MLHRSSWQYLISHAASLYPPRSVLFFAFWQDFVLVLHAEPVGLGEINAIFIFVHKFSVILLVNCSSSFLCCKISSVEVFSRSSVPWLSSLIVLPSCYWSRQLFSVTLKYVPLEDIVAFFVCNYHPCRFLTTETRKLPYEQLKLKTTKCMKYYYASVFLASKVEVYMYEEFSNRWR